MNLMPNGILLGPLPLIILPLIVLIYQIHDTPANFMLILECQKRGSLHIHSILWSNEQLKTNGTEKWIFEEGNSCSGQEMHILSTSIDGDSVSNGL